MSNANKECPFCGNTNVHFVQREVGPDNRTQMICEECGASGPLSSPVPPSMEKDPQKFREAAIGGDAEAMNLWNKRRETNVTTS